MAPKTAEEPKEPTPDEQVAKIAALVASIIMFLVTMLGICSIFLPWWVGSASTGNLSSDVGSIGLDASVTLWSFELVMDMPISPFAPDLHTVTITSDWSTWCRAEEIRRRAWPPECVTLEVTRAFSILTPILALFAVIGLLYGMFEPLSLLAGAALSLLAGLCAAVGVVCGVLIDTNGLLGVGFFMLVVCAVLSMASLSITLYAAAKAMPLDDPRAGKDGVVLSRMQRSQTARDQETALAVRLDANVRNSIAAFNALGGAAGGDTTLEEGLEPQKNYVHVTRVIKWAEEHVTDEKIPDELLEEAFQEMDDDRSGRVEIDELIKALRAGGLPASEAATQALIKDIDQDNSGAIEIQEFVDFFRQVEELERFQHRTEQRAQFLTIVCSGCFLLHIVLVGVVLMLFIQMDEEETGEQNYSIVRNALFVLAINLGILFVMVILIPALKLTLGANAAAWRRQWDKRFAKGKKKRPGASEAAYDCRFQCGFKGPMKEVQTHEKNCPARGNKAAPQGGMRQGWTGGAEQGTTVNAAIFGASYRVRKAQAELAKLNRDWRECTNGCGFAGTNEEVSQHEYACPLRRRASVASLEDAANAPPPPGVLLNEDGQMDRYDPLAFRVEQMNQLSQRQPMTFVTMAGRDTGQQGGPPEQTVNPNMLAIDYGNATGMQ